MTKQLCWPRRVHEEPPSSVLTITEYARSPESEAAVHSRRKASLWQQTAHHRARAIHTHGTNSTQTGCDILAQDWLACIINKIIAVRFNCQKKGLCLMMRSIFWLSRSLSVAEQKR